MTRFRRSPIVAGAFLALLALAMSWVAPLPLQGQQKRPQKKQDVARKKTRPRSTAQVPAPTLANHAYGGHERQVLDFWKADAQQATPWVFVIHGGGWRAGDKDRVGRFVDVNRLLAAGISVVAINYRFVQLAPEAGVEPPVRLPLMDAARALQYVRQHSAEWNLDPTRVGAAGGSAGACSSLWLAFHDDLADPQNADPIARQSTRLTCAAVTGAQTSLDPRQMKSWTPNSTYGAHAFGITANRATKSSAFAEFLKARERILPWIQEYSPYALVTREDPAVYLTYSAPPAIGEAQRDPTHSANFGVKLKEHCDALKVECELVYPGAEPVVHPTPTDFLISKLAPRELP